MHSWIEHEILVFRLSFNQINESRFLSGSHACDICVNQRVLCVYVNVSGKTVKNINENQKATKVIYTNSKQQTEYKNTLAKCYISFVYKQKHTI